MLRTASLFSFLLKNNFVILKRVKYTRQTKWDICPICHRNIKYLIHFWNNDIFLNWSQLNTQWFLTAEKCTVILRIILYFYLTYWIKILICCIFYMFQDYETMFFKRKHASLHVLKIWIKNSLSTYMPAFTFKLK